MTRARADVKPKRVRARSSRAPKCAAACIVLLCGTQCAHGAAAPPAPAGLGTAAVAALIPAGVSDRAGWAADVVTGIERTHKTPTAERVCAVLAVIAQESGYAVDPAVPGLPRIVRAGLQTKLARLGPLAEPALEALLDGKAPGDDKTFRARIARLRTEGDLDRLFRDVAAAYRAQAPGSFAVASALSSILGRGAFADLNPITTAGSMQVKVAFARAVGAREGLDEDAVRDLLYTRAGGVRFGIARLIDYPAQYTDVVYRFADYNAGVYASRNAAFQSMLADLTAAPLALDGDVLAWDATGAPTDEETHTLAALRAFGAAHGVSTWTISSDVKKEKTQAFEDTASFVAVRSAWEKKHGATAPYARIPDVKLASPKLSRTLSTAWYAASVKKRYEACRGLAAAPSSGG